MSRPDNERTKMGKEVRRNVVYFGFVKCIIPKPKELQLHINGKYLRSQPFLKTSHISQLTTSTLLWHLPGPS